jgi:SPP1 family predicted phage head-tail adaptor
MIKTHRQNNINAGNLKDRLTLQQPLYAGDGRGGTIVLNYINSVDVWCQADPNSGSRELEQAAVKFDQPIRFIIRVQDIPLAQDWRIIYNGKTYLIHSVHDIEQRYQYWQITAYTEGL